MHENFMWIVSTENIVDKSPYAFMFLKCFRKIKIKINFCYRKSIPFFFSIFFDKKSNSQTNTPWRWLNCLSVMRLQRSEKSRRTTNRTYINTKI